MVFIINPYFKDKACQARFVFKCKLNGQRAISFSDKRIVDNNVEFAIIAITFNHSDPLIAVCVVSGGGKECGEE